MSGRAERDFLLGAAAGTGDWLALQARVWEPEAERMLDRIGIAPGARCVDVACGTVGILAALSRRAGPAGRVVGVDPDAAMLAAARAHVEREGLGNVRLSQAEAFHTTLPRDSFDLVHARFALATLGREEELVRELAALAAPGGMVAVQEPDAVTWACHPEPDAFPRLRNAVLEAYRLSGGNFNAGRRVFGLLRNAGLQNVQVRPVLLAFQGGHPYMRLPLQLAESLRGRILEAGILRAADLDRALAGYEEFLREPGGYMITFTVLQAWGRKPQR